RGRMLAKDPAIPRATLRHIQSLAKRVYRRRLEEGSCRSRQHRIANASRTESHDRRSERHRLQRLAAAVFHAREDQAPRTAEVIDDHISRYVPQEHNVGSATPAKPGQERTIADDDQPAPAGLGRI